MYKEEKNQSTEINFKRKKFLFKIILEKDNICFYLTSKDFKNLKGNLSLEKAISQIHSFEIFSIQEVFNAVKDLAHEKYSLSEDSGKYELTIKLKVLRKEKPLKIDLEEFQKSKNYIISELEEMKIFNEFKLSNLRKKQSELNKECQKLIDIKKDLDKKIKSKKSKKEVKEIKDSPKKEIKEIKDSPKKGIPIPPSSIIISHQEEVPIPPPLPPVYIPSPSYSYNYSETKKEYKSKKSNKFYKGDELYKDFNIGEIRERKKIKGSNSYINSICVLKDKSLVTCTNYGIKVYEPYTYKFKLEITIMTRDDKYNNLIGLSSGRLLFSTNDKFIKIYEIKGKQYKEKQKMNIESPEAIELIDNGLAIRSHFDRIIFYSKNSKDTYDKENEIHDETIDMFGMVQIDENKLCVSCKEKGDDKLLFFNLDNKKPYATCYGIPHTFYGVKLNDDYVVFYENNIVYLISIENAYLVAEYKTTPLSDGGKNRIFAMDRLTSTSILISDESKNFIKLKIKNDDFIEAEKVRSPHNADIHHIFVIGDGHVATSVKNLLIW